MLHGQNGILDEVYSEGEEGRKQKMVLYKFSGGTRGRRTDEYG